MKPLTFSDGTATVTLRRTEASDAVQISGLMTAATEAVFGRVNVTHVLEMANLAVTLSNLNNDILAHAAFLDYPSLDLVDQARWEPWLREHFSLDKCTPLNTLFIHLFVVQPSFSTGGAKDIIRTVFSAIPELHYILLVIPSTPCLEPALAEIFEPVTVTRDLGYQASAFVCHRHSHLPTLHVRRARVEDHDDLSPILAEHSRALATSYGPYFLTELIEDHHTAVCEDEGTAVGFMATSTDVNLKLLNECFELGPFDGLRKPVAECPPEVVTCSSLETRLPEESNDNSHSDQESVTTESNVYESSNSNRASKPDLDLGAPNAFCIQLFFVDKIHEMRSVDFLPYIFALFPDHDFCIISIPKMAPEFPLLRCFLRVAPSPTCTLPHELYICHRSGLLRSFEVRVALSADRAAIKTLLGNVTERQSILEDLDLFYEARRDPDGTPLQAFVAHVQEQVVGILITKNEEDIEYIRSHYNIENFIYFSHHQREEHGRLCHFVLNPIFHHYTRHFLKEALRLGYKSCLYYPVYFSSVAHQNAQVQSLVLSCMVPVQPRQQIEYPLDELGINAPSTQITVEQTPYALNHFNRKLTMEPKFTINARIVVVGASDTGISFLEALSFCPHLKFNNLTLISMHGYPVCYTNESMSFLATSHSYSEGDHVQLSLRSWVNVVEGNMTAIDRISKHVVLSAGKRVPYDHLILCTGHQYQVPWPAGMDVHQAGTGSELRRQRGRRYSGAVPSNLLTLNDPLDCHGAHRWLLANFLDQGGAAVVYGNSADVYSCVEALLSLGVTGSRIHLAHLPSDPTTPCFTNPAVQKAVTKAMMKKAVNVYNNCVLAQINDGQDPEPITSVCFTTDNETLKLDCSVFINLSNRGVGYDTFKAINDACLVYDGGLVIDSAFHTNDLAIRAAGPLTKYARRYHADHCSHAHFSSKEVGAQLAAALLTLFDPTLEPSTHTPSNQDCLVPVYTHAKIQGGRLPGGYHYLHASKPAICTPLATQMSSGKNGREMETGSTEMGNYFHLCVNQYGVVQSITCLCLKPIPVSDYYRLYGKHEQLLNQLCDRFDEGLIRDFYSYFREPWCMAILHDRFADFEAEIRHIMESTEVQDNTDSTFIPDLIQRVLHGELCLSEDPELYLRTVFEKSDGIAVLKRSMLNYLQYNRYHLTMYAQAGLL